MLLIRAIITGFGYKLGTELARWALDRFGRKPTADEAKRDLPEGLPTDPDKVGGPPGPAADPAPVTPRSARRASGSASAGE